MTMFYLQLEGHLMNLFQANAPFFFSTDQELFVVLSWHFLPTRTDSHFLDTNVGRLDLILYYQAP